MHDNKDYNNLLSSYFFILFILILSTSFVTLYLLQKEITEVIVFEVENNEKRVVKLESDMIGREFNTILSDLHYLHHAYEDLLRDDENHSVIAANWRVFSKQRKVYDQIRYLDKYGNENIRINFADSEATIVSDDFLQNKKDRYYFYETLELKEDMVFVSQIDLNIENGEIENPVKPMIRFSTPLYDNSGELHGVIVLNYLAENLLKEFRELSDNSRGDLVLLNADSYWISSDDNSKEWSFMYDERKNHKFRTDYPEEWTRIVDGDTQFLTSNGLFTSTKINLSHKFDSAADQVDPRIILGDGHWYIVSMVSEENVDEIGSLINKNGFTWNVLKKNALFLLFMTIGSAFISFLVFINQKNYLKIKYYSEYDSLTRIYNRRAGLAKLNNLLPPDDRRKVMISLCYVDINGLKEVNDRLGHKYGDELIVTSAQLMEYQIRENDFVMRLGGDEFMIVFIGINPLDAEKVWQRINAACNEINATENRPYLISLSHGIVGLENTKTTGIDDQIKKADEKMYSEKELIKKNIKIVRK